MNDAGNQPNYAQQNSLVTGVSEENIGNILQRGGEELALSKVSDRFTIRPTNPEASDHLATTLPAELSLEIPKVQLEEFIVAPDQRDQAMQTARESDQVAFASHVYQLENHPETLVYLTDQVTIQFAEPTAEHENHGTACAGVAIAEENNSGIVGVAPGCGFMPIRTTGYLEDNSIEQIFDWAINKGAAVISSSWGAASIYFPLSLRQRAALTRAVTQGRNGKGLAVKLRHLTVVC